MYVFRKLNTAILLAGSILLPVALQSQTPQVAKWTGVHVGVIGGITSGSSHLVMPDTDDNYRESLASRITGGRIGIRGGVDFNVKGFVVGALADWTWTNSAASFIDEWSDTSFERMEIKSSINQIATVRGRVGHTVGRSIYYVHGGWLIAPTKAEAIDTTINNVNASLRTAPLAVVQTKTTAVRVSQTRNGYTVGAGMEHYIARHLTVNAEYSYNQLGSSNVGAFSPWGYTDVSTHQSLQFSSVTSGISYHF